AARGAGARGGGAPGREPRLFLLVLPQLGFLGANIGFHARRRGTPRLEFALRHCAAADQTCRAVIRSTGSGELRLGLIQGRLGANSLAMGGTEIEIIEDRQPLTRDDPIAGVYVERLDPAARHGPDAGKMELVVSDATR